MSLPVVAIVGRPNVGKSTLFNRLAGRRISIVDDKPGVTRDRLSTICQMEDSFVELVDTGGFGVDELDTLSEHVEKQIKYAIEQANVILFVVDAQAGITAIDKKLADMLRKINDKPIILIANKADNQNLEYLSAEFNALGLGQPIPISALHGRGKSDLIEKIDNVLPEKVNQPAVPEMKLAIVGARNVGKSTFINALAGQERVIVSELAGTTRDAVDVRFNIDGQEFLAIDTAGVKKKSKIKNDIEYYSMNRAEKSIRRADVVLLIIDASVPVGQVTKKLAGYITENYKPCVIVINKWDLAKDKADINDYQKYLEKTLPSLNYAPISLTSAASGTNVKQTIKLAQSLFEQSKVRLTTSQLNKAIEQIRMIKPPSSTRAKGHPKFYYATQIDISPPTIVLFVNDTEAFDQNYQRFIINRMREILPFQEIPIRLIIREHRKS